MVQDAWTRHENKGGLELGQISFSASDAPSANLKPKNKNNNATFFGNRETGYK